MPNVQAIHFPSGKKLFMHANIKASEKTIKQIKFNIFFLVIVTLLFLFSKITPIKQCQASHHNQQQSHDPRM